jgi:NADH-quinone oxidoreductase subunit L
MGLSGFYSKDAILAQAFAYSRANPSWSILFYAVAGGAFLTAFYMFRLWFMTFAGEPRDHHVHEHAHESPSVMTRPLVVLAVLAVVAGWTFGGFSLPNLLEQARPAGTVEGMSGDLFGSVLTIPAEYESHEGLPHYVASFTAFGTALLGVLLAAAMYLRGVPSPAGVAAMFRPVYTFLANRWYFDELYHAIFVAPAHGIAAIASGIDRGIIDPLIHAVAELAKVVASVDAWIDRNVVDRLVDWTARATWNTGIELRKLQTGSLRQYVMFIVVGTVMLFVLASAILRVSLAG